MKPDKVYTCEGCGATFPTGISKATHCRNCKEYKTWKAEHGDVDAKPRADVEDERDSVFKGEGEPNEILRQILTFFPGVRARSTKQNIVLITVHEREAPVRAQLRLII